VDITTVDPSTGEELASFAYMPAQAISDRLDAAVAAQRDWRSASFKARAAAVRAVAGSLRDRADALARTAVREMGKPIAQALAEVEKCAWCCEYFAEHAEAMLADEPSPSGATRSYVAYRPLGTIFAIMPWNFPYWQVFRAAIPALMAGNAVVLKHAENTTRCGLEIERLFSDSGAPRGLFATLLISNDDADVLIADSRVSGVTLTGSERAGVAVGSAAGAALKKCVLELGGSDAFIVLADADLDLAVKTAVAARFQNNGQSCIAAKRFIVETSVHDRFLARFTEAAQAQRVGDPMDENTQLGPLARADLLQTLDAQVRDSLAQGAALSTGGRRIERPGNFYEPTVVANVTPGMPMFDAETFGPAAAVIRAENAEHAIELANRSSFGLGASVWTRDIRRGEQLATKLESGSAFINGMVASDPRLPFGGVKKSGYGRELGLIGVREFTNAQTVWIGPAQSAQPKSE
jgi:acyl-CoA reductase-like NAD-dependent aldehyde dehydrogenase